MGHESKTTTDHKKIKHWVEKRGGRPAIVAATASAGGSGMLRVDFGEPDASLKEIDWDQFFQIFDDNDLAFLYQEETADGGESRFFKFVAR